jgi:hypothetical protein
MVKIILNHMGVGDAIMLNGMVRHFAETGKVVVVAKSCHEILMRFMYRDLGDQVDYIFVDTTNPQHVWGKVFEYKNKVENCQIIPLSTYGVDDHTWATMTQTEGKSNWSEYPYKQAGVPHEYMRSKFKLVRDKERELKPPDEPYVFVHDDPERGRVIDVKTDKFVFKPHSKVTNLKEEYFETNVPNIFDYISIIENADEVHCMNSSYNWFIELLKLGTPDKNFFHTGVAHKYYTPPIVKQVFSDQVWTFVD